MVLLKRERVIRSMKGIWNRGYVFFGGKGGVGKTTCSAAFALCASRLGRRTLLVSTDPAHSLGDLWGCTIGPREVTLRENLWALEIDPQTESKRYIERIKEQLVRVVSPVILEELERQLDAAYVSPGAEEGAIFDKFLEIMEKVGTAYDLIVFDTAPTGHTLRLLSLPELLGAWLERLISKRRQAVKLMEMASVTDEELKELVRDDPVLQLLQKRREKFIRAREILVDNRQSVFIFVLTPERLPVLETEKAVELLSRYGIPLGGIIINQVLPAETDNEFLRRRRENQERYLKLIRVKFGSQVMLEIPLQPGDIDVEGLTRLAEAFGEVLLP